MQRRLEKLTSLLPHTSFPSLPSEYDSPLQQRVEAHSSRDVQTTSYMVYDKYSITSGYLTRGSCVITEEGPLALGTPFSYTVTASENHSEVQHLGLSSFQSFLGFSSCVTNVYRPGDNLIPLSPTVNSPTIPRSSQDPSTNASDTSVAAHATSSAITPVAAHVASSATTHRAQDLSRGQKVAIGTAIPVGGTALLVLALFLFWQRKKRQRAKRILHQPVQEERTEGNPSFLQTKTELQGENSRHQMLAGDLRFELDDHSRYEIMTAEQNRRLNLQVRQQELRGEEFAHELDERDTRA